jgi:D-psicose/D-tagatose/L-ribulose 3-epimerase
MHIEEADAAAAIRACGPALRHFHVNENHRGYLGAGSIDFSPIFRALVTAQYAGTISFEAFSSSTCTPSIAGKGAIWRSVFEDGEDVARRALDFLKSEMAGARRAMTQVGQ